MELRQSLSDKVRRWLRRFSAVDRSEQLLSSLPPSDKRVRVFIQRLKALNPSLCANCLALFESQILRKQHKLWNYTTETCPLCSLVHKARSYQMCYSPEDVESAKLQFKAFAASTSVPREYRLIFTNDPYILSPRDGDIYPFLSQDAAIVYKKSGGHPKALGAAGNLLDSTSSARTMSLVLDWLSHCDEMHDCTNSIGSWHPTRLLDLDSCAEKITLIHPQNETGIIQRYATLSHCWGACLPVRLVQGNMDSFHGGYPVNRLPQSFQDAIKVTKALKLRYLWIDALCIIQDSPEDWSREASLMHKVFKGCYVNIAATASENSTQGLFRTREAGFLDPCLINIPKTDPRKHSWDEYLCFLPEPDRWQSLVEKAPLASRGWVLQERWLSPRTLHFPASEVFWECTQHASETFPHGSPQSAKYKTSKGLDHITIGNPGTPGVIRIDKDLIGWTDLVQRYTACNLTYASDRPAAILAFAQAVQLSASLPADYYVAGIWRNAFTQGLLWSGAKPRVKPFYLCYGTPFTVSREPPKARLPHLPTWSWISIDGAVYFEKSSNTEYSSFKDCYDVREIYRQNNEDPFGLEQRIRLTLCAPLLLFPSTGLSELGPRSYELSDVGSSIAGFPSMHLRLKVDVEKSLPEELYFAPLVTDPQSRYGVFTHGLLLMPERSSESTFVRVGYCSV